MSKELGKFTSGFSESVRLDEFTWTGPVPLTGAANPRVCVQMTSPNGFISLTREDARDLVRILNKWLNPTG